MLPIRLSNLALEAFGKYLSGILEKLTALTQCTSIEIFNEEFMDPICTDLEEIIQKAVPRALADEVIESFLTELLKTYNYLEKHLTNAKHSSEIYEKQSHFYKQVTSVLCSAILHPAMREFKFSRSQFPEVKFSEAKVFVNSFLSVVLKKLANVKYLKLEIFEFDEHIILENMKIMENLEELTFFGCTDAIVDVVSDTCKKLRILDLRNSEKVTTISVESILKLKYLEQLNVRWTSIQPHGIEKLVHGLNVRETINPLESFQSMVLPYQVKLLPKYFPHLTSVELYIHQHFSLIPLMELKKLSHLGVFFAMLQSYSSVDLEELLQSVGSQLTSLKLVDFRENQFIDIFRIVAENCTVVEDLVFSAIPIHFTEEESGRIQLADVPALETVNYCEFRVFHTMLIEAVVPKCPNVRVLKCWCNDKRFETFVLGQLFRMRTGELEQFYVNNCILQVSGENVIISKNNGSYIFVHKSQIEEVLDAILHKRNIDIKILSFNDVAKFSYTSFLLNSYYPL